ncbi:MAG: metallophosphoesterase [Elusimicrobiota bacterium]
MRNTYSMIIFLLIFSFAFIGLHLYASSFISRNIKNFQHVRAFFLALAFLSIFSMFLRRSLDNDIFRFFSLAGFFWMGAVLVIAFVFSIADISMLFLRGKAISSRIPWFAVAISIFLSLKALYNGLSDVNLKKLDINLGLREPVKIAFLSDAHADFPFRKKLFFKSLEKAMAENPDFLILGGDLLDPGFQMSDEEFKKLRELKAEKIAVLGNHEYYYGLDKARDFYEKAGFKLIVNSSALVNGINFIGLADIRTENMSREESLKVFSSLYRNEAPNILLSHEPVYFDSFSSKHRVLMLSGHVHKAQIFPFHFFVRLAYRYFYGFYPGANGSSLYVSSGSGTWGPPMRLLAEAEIPIISVR